MIDAPLSPPADPPAADEPASGTLSDRLRVAASAALVGLSRTELAALFMIGLLPLSIAAFTYTDHVVQRIAVVAIVGVVGLGLTVREAVVNRVAAAWALLAFLAVALISALASPTPWQSLHGSYSTHLSLFAYSISLGWWALGRSLSSRAVRTIPWVLLPGAGVNALLAFFEVALRQSSFPGRGAGLMSNPVYLGSFMSGIALWVVAVASERPRLGVWLAVAGGFGAAVGITGSRAAAISLVVIGAVAVAARRHRSVVAAYGVSLVGLVVASLFGTWSGSAGTVERLADASGGLGQRTDVWVYGVKAFGERPIVGWGIGHYATATQRYFTPEFINRLQYDDLSQPFVDPHNLFILLLTCTGALGVIAFAAFLALGVKGQRDLPLLLSAVAIASTWGLQPATVHSLPLGALLFGAAVRSDEVRAEMTMAWRKVLTACAAMGVVLGGYLLVADAQIRMAIRNDPADVERALSWYHRNPVAATYAASYYRNRIVDGDESPETMDRMVYWSERVVEWAPGSAGSWTFLADTRLYEGDLPGVKDAIDRAIEIQPYNPTAWRLTVSYARLTGDAQLERDGLAVACDLGIDLCEQGPRLAP